MLGPPDWRRNRKTFTNKLYHAPSRDIFVLDSRAEPVNHSLEYTLSSTPISSFLPRTHDQPT